MKSVANEPLRDRLARNVKTLRGAKQWSQEALAEAAGLSQVYVSNIETSRKAASIDVLQKLALAFSVDARDLLSD
jgi:transcriptional regulator with XRE-family HTH domain